MRHVGPASALWDPLWHPWCYVSQLSFSTGCCSPGLGGKVPCLNSHEHRRSEGSPLPWLILVAGMPFGSPAAVHFCPRPFQRAHFLVFFSQNLHCFALLCLLCHLPAQALRSPVFHFLQTLEQRRQEIMGDDLDRTVGNLLVCPEVMPSANIWIHAAASRIVSGFWHRVPDGTEAPIRFVCCGLGPSTRNARHWAGPPF